MIYHSEAFFVLRAWETPQPASPSLCCCFFHKNVRILSQLPIWSAWEYSTLCIINLPTPRCTVQTWTNDCKHTGTSVCLPALKSWQQRRSVCWRYCQQTKEASRPADCGSDIQLWTDVILTIVSGVLKKRRLMANGKVVQLCVSKNATWRNNHTALGYFDNIKMFTI